MGYGEAEVPGMGYRGVQEVPIWVQVGMVTALTLFFVFKDPGRVWPGKRMAGRMGGVRVTTQSLKVNLIPWLLPWLRPLFPWPFASAYSVSTLDTFLSPLTGLACKP